MIELHWQNPLLLRWVRMLFWCGCVAVGVLALLPETPRTIILDFWDKAQHIAAFFVLGVLGLLVYLGGKVKVMLGLCLYGGSIELLQWAGGFRVGSLGDWVADLVGLALAYGLTIGLLASPGFRRNFFQESSLDSLEKSPGS